MKTNGKITASVLAIAIAATACSKIEETSLTSVPKEQSTAKLIPVSMTKEPESIKPIEPKIVGPVKYADGESAYNAGRYSDAIKVFEEYTVEKPKNSWGHFMLGMSASKGGEPAKAEKAFEEALRIDPKHFKSLVNLSRVLIDEKRYDDAVGKLEIAGNIEPKSADVHRLLGRAHHGKGKIDNAIESYRVAITLDEKDAWSMNNLGFLYLEQGRSSEALPVLARAVELKKDVPVFHNNLGMALERSGRFGAAATEYKSAADSGYGKAKSNLERVEAVKVVREEPFDLEATAKQFIESMKTPTDSAVAVK